MSRSVSILTTIVVCYAMFSGALIGLGMCLAYVQVHNGWIFISLGIGGSIIARSCQGKLLRLAIEQSASSITGRGEPS